MTDWLANAPRVRPVNGEVWDAIPVDWIRDNAQPKPATDPSAPVLVMYHDPDVATATAVMPLVVASSSFSVGPTYASVEIDESGNFQASTHGKPRSLAILLRFIAEELDDRAAAEEARS